MNYTQFRYYFLLKDYLVRFIEHLSKGSPMSVLLLNKLSVVFLFVCLFVLSINRDNIVPNLYSLTMYLCICGET